MEDGLFGETLQISVLHQKLDPLVEGGRDHHGLPSEEDLHRVCAHHAHHVV